MSGSSTEFSVNSTTSGAQDSQSVTDLTNGGFVVTWSSYDQDGSRYGIFAQIYDSNGSKSGDEFQVNTHESNDQKEPSVTSLNGGGFVVAWESDQQDGNGYGVYGQVFDKDGEKSGNEFKINTHNSSDQSSPSATTLSDNTFVVTWKSSEQDESGYGIYSQLFKHDGNKIGEEFRVNSYTSGTQERPVVTSLNDGFIVAWDGPGTEDGSGIFGQIFNNSGEKIDDDGQFQINTYTTNGQYRPSATGLNDGTFVVTWDANKHSLDSLYGIIGQVFKHNGDKIGDEFKVNTETDSYQWNSSIAYWGVF